MIRIENSSQTPYTLINDVLPNKCFKCSVFLSLLSLFFWLDTRSFYSIWIRELTICDEIVAELNATIYEIKWRIEHVL